MIFGILHHGFTVSDIDKALAWYVDALGLELVHRQRQDNDYTRKLVGVEGAVLEVAQLRIPGTPPGPSTHDIELIQYVAEQSDGEAVAVNQVGAGHLAFLVDGIEALVARARAAGARFRNEPVSITEGANAGGAACYLHDPDGNTLEFLQPSPERLRRIRTAAS
ncbi:VOC family protein [Kribbella sp. NPDC051952]|uniref:VOC family protein n=1 Tax=Kribbella sp. NPDC051952 TaxID=3154851 RepID=UPI00342EFF05